MARVLVKNGLLLLTDVIVSGPIDDEIRRVYGAAGLRYYCKATIEDFMYWMATAGFRNIVVEDLTQIVESIWKRRMREPGGKAVKPLLEGELALSRKLFYLYFRGEKCNELDT